MKKFCVVFHTKWNYNIRIEYVEADNRGEAVARIREKYGSIAVVNVSKVKVPH